MRMRHFQVSIRTDTKSGKQPLVLSEYVVGQEIQLRRRISPPKNHEMGRILNFKHSPTTFRIQNAELQLC